MIASEYWFEASPLPLNFACTKCTRFLHPVLVEVHFLVTSTSLLAATAVWEAGLVLPLRFSERTPYHEWPCQLSRDDEAQGRRTDSCRAVSCITFPVSACDP